VFFSAIGTGTAAGDHLDHALLWTTIPAACLEDLDADGTVGPADLGMVLGGRGSPSPDVDGDGIVGLADLAQVHSQWGSCSE
jgi:hypothetical protein